MVKWSRIKTLLILSLLFLYVNNVSARSAESISAVKYVLCSDHNVIERSFGTSLEIYTGVNKLQWEFNENLVATDDAYAYIVCGDEVFAKQKLHTYKVPCDKFFIEFEDGLDLPVGRTYRAVIPAGVLYRNGDPATANEEAAVEIRVCDTFDKADDKYFDLYNNNFSTAQSFLFKFYLYVWAFDDAEMSLLRNGIEIMRFTAKEKFGDFDLGYVEGTFGKELNFEKDMCFSFVLPKGSVHSEREDIVNKEVRKDFVGKYHSTFAPIEYESCSVAGASALTVLDEVNVTYTTPVQLAPNARLQLVDADGNVLKEATAVLSHNDKAYSVEADFAGFPLNDSDSYALCIPEATVVGSGSDITVNQRTLVPIKGGVVSVECANRKQPLVALCGSTLSISNAYVGDRIVVYDAAGIIILRTTVKATDMQLPLPQRSHGVYIVKLNGTAYKVK